MNKKHLVVMVGGYKPFVSPGTLIVDRLISQWKNDYDITVIASLNHKGLKEQEEIDGIKVYRVEDYNRRIHNDLLDKKLKSKGIKELVYSFEIKVKQLIFYVYRIFRFESISKGYAKRLCKKLVEIDSEKKIDCLISSVDPHENSAGAYLFKKKFNKDVKWIIYQLDRFANANSLYLNKIDRKIKEKRHYKREINYLQSCAKLFVLNPIKEHYDQPIFDEYRQRIVATDHPLLIKPSEEIKGFNGDKTVLIYGGSLDVKLRNPQVMLDIVALASKEIALKFDIYANGNCESILEQAVKENAESIVKHSIVPRNELVQNIANSDIVVNVGNNSDNELPSKFFDLLSYGLPIVHFYFSDKDAIIDYLKDYPYSLSLKLDKTKVEENAKKLVEFCKEVKGKKVGFDMIKNTYKQCTPEYVAKTIGREI